MKYILYKIEGEEDFKVVVFADHHIAHVAMATMINDSTVRIVHFISAGFFMLINGQPFATGESITLNLKSRPEDSEIITNLLRG